MYEYQHQDSPRQLNSPDNFPLLLMNGGVRLGGNGTAGIDTHTGKVHCPATVLKRQSDLILGNRRRRSLLQQIKIRISYFRRCGPCEYHSSRSPFFIVVRSVEDTEIVHLVPTPALSTDTLVGVSARHMNLSILTSSCVRPMLSSLRSFFREFNESKSV